MSAAFSTYFDCNVLSQNNMLPFWEKVHTYFLSIFIIVMTVFESTASYPRCVSGNPDEPQLTAPEKDFLGMFCSVTSNHFWTPFQFCCSLAFLIVVAKLTGNAMLTMIFKTSVEAYVKSEKLINNLRISETDMMTNLVNPITKKIDVDTDEMKIRKALLLLLHCDDNPKLIILLSCRIVVIFLPLLLSSIILYWSYRCIVMTEYLSTFASLLTGDKISSPTFLCSVNRTETNWTNLNGRVFLCTYYWTPNDSCICDLYALIVLCHIVFYIAEMFNMYYMISKISKKLDNFCCSKRFRNSARNMLLLNEFCEKSRAQRSLFNAFVSFVFSKETLNMMKRSIPTACGGNPFINIMINSNVLADSTEISIESGYDEEYLKIAHLIFEEGLSSKKCGHDAVSLNELMNERKWKSIVLLLNNLCCPFNDLAPLANKINVLDEFGNNILFYALCKPTGCIKLKAKAAEEIMKVIPTKDRTVCCHGNEVFASNFVENQFKEDAMYSKELKDVLLKYISQPYAADGGRPVTVDI